MTVSDSGGRYVISCEQLAELSSDSLQNYGLDEAEFGPDGPLLPPPTLNFIVSHGSQKSLLNTKRSMTQTLNDTRRVGFTVHGSVCRSEKVPSHLWNALA